MSVNEDPSNWRLETAGGIKYKLMEDTPSGSFEEEQAVAKETYIIQASDLFSFVEESFPPMITYEHDELFYASKRTLPGRANFITKKISFKNLTPGKPCDPFGADDSAPEKTYDQFLLIDIDYATGKQGDPQDPETFMEISGDASGEYLNLPARGEWTSPGDGSVVEAAVAARMQVIPETTWSIRWTQVPRNLIPTMVARARPCLGHINTAAMPILFNASFSTVLFMGYSFREQLTWRTGLEDEPPAEFEFKFLEKHFVVDDEIKGHNHFYREETGTFDLLFNVGGSQTYPFTDLNSLFPPLFGGG